MENSDLASNDILGLCRGLHTVPSRSQSRISFSSKIALLTSIQTPRWLMANDRTEEALDVMAKYHGEGDRNSPIVQLEYEEMRSESKTPFIIQDNG
jgi:hypothetical protein